MYPYLPLDRIVVDDEHWPRRVWHELSHFVAIMDSSVMPLHPRFFAQEQGGPDVS